MKTALLQPTEHALVKSHAMLESAIVEPTKSVTPIVSDGKSYFFLVLSSERLLLQVLSFPYGIFKFQI